MIDGLQAQDAGEREGRRVVVSTQGGDKEIEKYKNHPPSPLNPCPSPAMEMRSLQGSCTRQEELQ